MASFRHFLDLNVIDTQDLQDILDRAAVLKSAPKEAQSHLAGRSLAMIFEKPSTRTRVSFEVGVQEMGGFSVVMSSQESQLGRGESVHDTAKVLSRYVDMVMIRTFRHATLLELARHADVPVINGLTDNSHPCQVLADVMTLRERLGTLEGKIVCWTGDYNNMATSWVHAAEHFGFTLHLACPEELAPPANLPEGVKHFTDAREAAQGADCITTDTWVSMGDEESDSKRAVLGPYQVNEGLMEQASADAVFLHCLPAHRGEEVSDGVMDGPQSAVWDEAENRLHVQKAIMLWCLGL